MFKPVIIEEKWENYKNESEMWSMRKLSIILFMTQLIYL
jgi:hypothetical protein